MKFNVEGIDQGTRLLEETYTSKQLEFPQAELVFLSLLAVKVKVTRMGDDVLVECDLHTRVEQTCCRCLENYGLGIDTQFQTLFVPAKPASHRQGARRPLSSNEDDYIVRYKGQEIDLSPEIWGAVQLALPMKPLCQVDCRGLCQGCGENLNLSSCRCAQKKAEKSHNPFRDLRLLADEKK